MNRQLLKLGIIGWRGMVGSVLMERMRCEEDFKYFHVTFFSTSQAGQAVPKTLSENIPTYNVQLQDANNLTTLKNQHILISTQGGAYSEQTLPQLRAQGWQGYWIDAASTFRMAADTKIVLGPLNQPFLLKALHDGVRNFASANCSTATMLLGLAGLFHADLVQWVSFMSYQSISGAGAAALTELIQQQTHLSQELMAAENSAKTPLSALEMEAVLTKTLFTPNFPTQQLGTPLAYNILPWIDTDLATGSSREEVKTMAESNKILETQTSIPIDGTCVRVGVLRSHSFGCSVRLKENLPLAAIEKLIADAHPWVRVVPNTQAATLATLTPANATGSLNVYVGRLRKQRIDPYMLNAFILTDQLLWGAAEPLRRILRLLLQAIETTPALIADATAKAAH